MKTCINCKTRLSRTELSNALTAFSCDTCRGHWIPSENYMRWIERKGGIEPMLSQSEGHDAISESEEVARICPDCSRFMIKAKVGRDLSYSVDRCSCCQGIWLDADEWNSLKSRNLHDEIYMMYTSIWKHGEQSE